jgi:peptide/nickel transport system permease protein
LATEPYSEPALEQHPGREPGDPGFPPAPEGVAIEGRSPWYLAYRRLRRNKTALAFLGLFILILIFVIAAPLWATKVAHTGPDSTHTLEKITVNGQRKDVVTPEGQPIAPVWFGAGGKFFLGADGRLGRDEMVRLMYGGRVSLFIGIVSGIITTLFGVVFALIAAYYGGWVDGVFSRIADVVWAFPVVLLGLAIGTALAISGLQLGPITIANNSIWIPILIIGGVYIPYMYRPIRGEVLALREKEFVEASIAQGAGAARIMFGEILPNIWSTVIVFFTLNIANNMILESYLSFLGAGVQPPSSSWGTMSADGFNYVYSDPILTLIPALMILLTVLSLNVFGDGLRDALDPKAKLRLEARTGKVEPEGAVETEGV